MIGGTTPGVGNLISGNIQSNGTGVGVYIIGPGATGNVVQGNRIGTDATGTQTLIPGQSNLGILISNTPGSNVVGGTDPGAGNVIAGFTTGIYIFATQSQFAPTAGSIVVGNFIGTDKTGEVPLGNTVGVYINGVPMNTIGGAGPSARNIISGNQTGIYLLGTTATTNLIQGNYIGLNADGQTAMGNHIGIYLDQASNNTLAAPTSSRRQSASSAMDGSVGIYLFNGAANNTIEGNLIGTDASGRRGRDLAQGNYGVLLFNASNNPIAKSLGTNRVVGSGIANLREFTGPVTQPRSGGGRKPGPHHPHRPAHAGPRKLPGFSRLARRPFVRAR